MNFEAYIKEILSEREYNISSLIFEIYFRYDLYNKDQEIYESLRNLEFQKIVKRKLSPKFEEILFI